MTMNPQPVHLDESFARETKFGTRLVNSLLTLSTVVGISVYETTLGTTIANLGFQAIAFPAPVRHGDSLHAEPEVVAARPSSSRPAQGIGTLEHRGYNHRAEPVVQAQRPAHIQSCPAT